MGAPAPTQREGGARGERLWSVPFKLFRGGWQAHSRQWKDRFHLRPVKCANLPEPAEDARPCNDPLQVVGGVLSVISGIGQIGGLALLLEGTFMRTRVPAPASASWQPRNRRLHLLPPAPDFRRAHAPTFSLVPVLTPSVVGAVMSGSF